MTTPLNTILVQNVTEVLFPIELVEVLMEMAALQFQLLQCALIREVAYIMGLTI